MVLRGLGSVSSVSGIAAPVCEGDFAAEPPILPAGSGWRMSAQSGLSLISLDGAPLIPSVSNRFRVKLGLKRMLDIGLSVSALFLLAPFFLLIMMRIKTESAGPTLFRQWREGLRGRPIEVIKFRSMYACFADHSGREQVTADDIMDVCRRYPMMSEYQVVIVKECQAKSDVVNKLHTYVSQP